MHKLIVLIATILVFIGCIEKASGFKSLNRPVISLIIDRVFEDKSFGESAWKGIQMLKQNCEVEVFVEIQ